MNVAFYIFVVLCWTSGQATAAALSNNYESQSKELNGKAVGALPILHIVFDIASGANAQSLSGATRNLLNKLQNAAQNFNSETMMSVSSYTGSDSGDGNYLKVLIQPVNVIQNSQALISVIQSMSGSVTSNVNRDPGAAIRDAVNFFSQFIPGAGGILYLLSRRYVDSGPTVKELNMIDTLLSSNMTLICVEGTNTNDPNRIFNLNRIARLTEGYYFTNNQSTSWTNTNDAASNLLITLARSPINSVRRVIGRTEYFGVSDVAQTGSILVTPDLGNNSVMSIQSSQKGIVTVALTNIQTGATATLKTQGGTNWNMINANLYVDDLAFPSGETRGRWTYGVTFEPAIDALDTKSDVVILGLSSINTNPINYLPAVWTLNCDLELTAQQSTIIYAEVVGPVGILTGLSITVNLKNIDDTSSQDISIILIEEVEGMGLYSGIFIPPSGGQYNFSADFKADVDSACIGELCAPSSFTASALGWCQISSSGPSATSSDISSTNTPSTSTASPSTTAGDTSRTPIMSTTGFMTTSEITTVEDITSTLDADTSTPDGTIIISSTVTDMASTPITTTEPVTTPEISSTLEDTTATHTIIPDGTTIHSSTVTEMASTPITTTEPVTTPEISTEDTTSTHATIIHSSTVTDMVSSPITTTGSITTPATSTLVDTTTTTATRPDSTIQSSTPTSNTPSTSVIPTTTRSTTIGTTTAKNVCVWNKNGNFAISPCNSKFIMCSNGNAYILDCPIGLFYNSILDFCDFARSVGTGC